jgi:hypothetical protein
MPLVFVHGVNVRRGTTEKEICAFDEQIKTRDSLFRTISLAGLVSPPSVLHVENPYWGDLGARFRFNLATVPTRDTEAFGPANEVMSEVFFDTIPLDVAQKAQNNRQPESNLLLTLARQRSLAHAVDALVTAAAVSSTTDLPATSASAKELAVFAAHAAAYISSSPDLRWINEQNPRTGLPLETDEQFLDRLVDIVSQHERNAALVERFGGIDLGERLKTAARALGSAAKKAGGVVVDVARGAFGGVEGLLVGTLAGAVVGAAPGPVVKALRPTATRRAGVFVGDIFKYLNDRQPIQEVVTAALKSADAKRNRADPTLVVIGHSMGGNILYDLFTSRLAGAIEVDAFVTVGSQVGLFKELELYTEDARNAGATSPASTAAPQMVEKPAAVGTWINVFDPLDMLGFAIEGVFKDVHDFAFSNGASVLETHSLYFFRPAFHERLWVRLASAGIGKKS